MIGAVETQVVLAAEQARIDALARDAGVPASALVESAGAGAAAWLLENVHSHRVSVFAGTGGNGADALVVARVLAVAGLSVRVLLASSEERLSPVAGGALARLRSETPAVRVEPSAGGGAAGEALDWSTLAVDGLTGSGVTRPLAGSMADLVAALCRRQTRVVSLDVPSGVAADSGDVPGPAVLADVTLAMQFLKPAHLLFPGAARCGNVARIPVAYPDAVLDDVRPVARVLGREGAKRRLPPRDPAGHKGTFGRVVIVAGSRGMTGAALLACRGALRAGAGLVTLGIPESLAATVNAAVPEAITVGLPEADGRIAHGSREALAEALDRADVLAIGPGLGRGESVLRELLRLVGAFAGPVVVDADALVALAADPGRLDELAGRAIVTPHPGELAQWTGDDPDVVDRGRIAAARAFAALHGVVTALKGRPTVVALPDGQTFLNPTGHAGLATGGSGDVLTGVIAGLLGGGASLADAALVGAFVHGRAAELFSADRAERSLLPSDVLDLLPAAFREVER